jgi:shikimate 5-dehydrogenase
MPAGEPPRGEGFDLVVNATSLGLGDEDPLPLEVEVCREAGAAFDLVYRAGGTRWTRALAAAGIPAVDGAGDAGRAGGGSLPALVGIGRRPSR